MYQPKLRKQRSGIPIMRNSEIDVHAEEFLLDYKPSLLKTPQPVDIEAFAEFYLDLALDYAYLSHCGLILGRMVFQETERVPVYLPEEKCADYLYAKRGTLLIDNTLLEDRKEYRLRSTIGHVVIGYSILIIILLWIKESIIGMPGCRKLQDAKRPILRAG